MRKLSPFGWALQPLKNYARFSGRASRAEFWWFFLFMMIVYVAFWVVLFAVIGVSSRDSAPSPALMGTMGIVGLFMIVFYLGLLLPIIAVQIRRLHDIDRSGWWLGAFWLMYPIYMLLIVGSSLSIQAGPTGPSHGVALAIASAIFAVAFFIYSIVLLVFWCMPGTKGANRFGEDPYGPDIEQVFA